MFGKRCTLCGGKLDSKNICTECGLNNNQSEKNYKVNQSSCDGKPLTHVHEEEKPERYRVPAMERTPKTDSEKKTSEEKRSAGKKAEETYSYSAGETSGGTYSRTERLGEKKRSRRRREMNPQDSGRKKGGLAKKVVAVFVVVSVLGTVVETLSDIGIHNIFQNFSSGGESGYERSYPYEKIEEEKTALPDSGGEAEFDLPSGKYIVGVHIPAGNYEAVTKSDYDVVEVDDWEHSIYLYEWTGSEEENYLNDLRLFAGAVMTITAENPVTFKTENAQGEEYEDNPLTEGYTFSGGDSVKTAGKDFEPGVYDLEVLQGTGTVGVTIYDAEEGVEELRTYNLYLGEDNMEGMHYRNVILPEEAEILMTDDGIGEEFVVSMTPSPRIEGTDYLQTYMNYDYY